jgi:hypothetical protein
MLGKISQSYKDKYCMFSLTRGSKRETKQVKGGLLGKWKMKGKGEGKRKERETEGVNMFKVYYLCMELSC